MKATRIHYFYAEDWPARIWFSAITWGVEFAALVICVPVLISTWSLAQALRFVLIIVVAPLWARYVAIVTGWPILGPTYFGRGLKNGEPFQEGDVVQILVGPHRDRVARVCKAFDFAEFAGAHRIFLDLGEEAKQKNEDVFRSFQILRIERPIGKP